MPVGEDKLPVIEQCVEIVRAFNRIYAKVLVEPKGLVSEVGRLRGIDGQAKMGKSLGNAIYLSDSADAIAKKVKSMYTDPGHLRVEDPGKTEGNIVFTYLDVFDPRAAEISDLKTKYRKGGLGDVVLKKRLTEVLESVIGPIRSRREALAKDPAEVMKIIRAGTERGRVKAAATMAEVERAMRLDYFSD